MMRQPIYPRGYTRKVCSKCLTELNELNAEADHPMKTTELLDTVPTGIFTTGSIYTDDGWRGFKGYLCNECRQEMVAIGEYFNER